jgi:sarcosine oxidase subunit gamma
MAETTGVTITRPAPRAAAGIASFRDSARCHAALEAEFGAKLPAGPGFVQAGDVTLSRLAPARMLATAPRAQSLPARLAKILAGLAAVMDQSDLWVVFALSGPNVRDALARLVPIDLDPAQFRIGDLALTRAGHLDVRLWRLDAQNYELAVARSYCEDLGYLLEREGSVLF